MDCESAIEHGIQIDRIDNGDGTHSLAVDHVVVAVVPANDTEISGAIMRTIHRIEKEERFA